MTRHYYEDWSDNLHDQIQQQEMYIVLMYSSTAQGIFNLGFRWWDFSARCIVTTVGGDK